ncbi:MAG: hypothetical protein Q8O88_06255 [bacterium]|nr:hypothetical protein [bacterium]
MRQETKAKALALYDDMMDKLLKQCIHSGVIGESGIAADIPYSTVLGEEATEAFRALWTFFRDNRI